MANRCALTNQIETLSGAISAATYFDANWNNPVTALNDASLGYFNAIATDSGSANNYIVTCVYGVPTAYNPGMPLSIIAANTNTGASTLTVSPLVSASILDWSGAPLIAGAIQANNLFTVVYVAGNFRILDPGAGSSKVNLANTPVAFGAINFNCLSAAIVNMVVDGSNVNGTGTFTITLTNVAYGSTWSVLIITKSINQTFKWTGTDQAGNTLNSIQSRYAQGNTASATVNLITNGDSAPSTMLYVGAHFFNPNGSVSQLRFNGTFA